MVRFSPSPASFRRHAALPLAEQALAEILGSRSLRNHRLTRHCAIGPYIVDYVYSERALVVEIQPAADRDFRREPEKDAPGKDSPHPRQRFLAAMGYSVLSLSSDDVLRRPLHVLEQIRTALR